MDSSIRVAVITGFVRRLARRLAHRAANHRALHERPADGIHAVLERGRKALPVAVRERADTGIDARQVEPLPRAPVVATIPVS